MSAGTQRLFDELQFAASPFPYSASESDSAPVSKEVRPKRKPRSPKSAAHQAEYHARWRKTAKGGAAIAAAYKRWGERYPERIKAHRAVSYAVRTGRLARGPCELAGQGCKGRIEAHHDDYSRPLEVRWACRRHHEQLDRERRGAA